MLQLRSMITVADNTGAKVAQLIGIPGKGNIKKAGVGMIVTVVVKKADAQGSMKKGDVSRAVIVRTRKEFRRKDGSYIRFDDNACIMLEAQTEAPKGSRVFGPISREVRTAGFAKIASLATEIY
ncbi:50S ribosomal protein L14 [Candidatus Roizmanbacteria bacterium CG10_big_fil_rev_8_21_14_0_10_45_7]|uniref:Large ribosomal subunit protein uL14 n=1 Tax=Candidatus Roizmanbacteria bacterium CG10_big_fil_rev_8_21_14_0_10_45_7 TaxID=1974854 RepID=A0A2M8KUA7_9BACT|nr:MAG: 50S ribosomal protein L14 [Candidatus Roizmanbacteria bacterium CG10_big_fil_rev_8_21_14_0_10_45_7]